jgi:hypothetical protein
MEFRLSEYFTVNVDRAFRSSRHVDMGSISDILQVHSACIFRGQDVPMKFGNTAHIHVV